MIADTMVLMDILSNGEIEMRTVGDVKVVVIDHRGDKKKIQKWPSLASIDRDEYFKRTEGALWGVE